MGGTIVSTFLERTKDDADRVAFRRKVDGEYQPITWADYERDVRRITGALRALGIDADDRTAILSNNRYEWHVADLATQSLGGVTVPIYQTNAPDQVGYIAGHSGSKVVFCEDAGQVDKVLQVRDDLPEVVRVVVFDPTGASDDDLVSSFEAFATTGEAFNADNPDDFARHVDAVRPEQLCTLVYTSGTTGRPKGVMLTHHNVAWTIESLQGMIPSGRDDRRLSYLPLSHIAERVVSDFSHIFQGFETWFAGSIDTLREDLNACKPTVFFGVPRVWEKFYDGITGMIAGLDPETREKAEQAIQLGLKRVEAQQAGASLPAELEAKYQEADGQLFALARGAIGLDQAKHLISGAAPINQEILRFFHAIGLPVAEVYGQTEDCGPTSLNPSDRIKIGTVGPPIPGVEVRIADDGEILVKGGNVGLGYYKDEEATAELLADEWMHTGDVGVLDDDGYLVITDRKKDLIITAAGKNIAPQVIENELKHQPWISQAVVVGDRRKYLIALVTLDQEKVTEFAEQKSIPFEDFADLVEHPDIKQLVEHAVTEVNADHAKVEQVKKWHVFDREFQLEEGEVTPTLKIRRRIIIDKFSELIDQIYAE